MPSSAPPPFPSSHITYLVPQLPPLRAWRLAPSEAPLLKCPSFHSEELPFRLPPSPCSFLPSPPPLPSPAVEGGTKAAAAAGASKPAGTSSLRPDAKVFQPPSGESVGLAGGGVRRGGVPCLGESTFLHLPAPSYTYSCTFVCLPMPPHASQLG